MPKISVIAPCYNQEKYIAKAIDSMLAQTFTDWEQVIVDDGSTDNSAEIILSYTQKDSRIKLVEQPNGGVQNARNNGFKACSHQSEYLLWFDPDDCLAPQMLEVMVNYLNTHPHVGLAFCDYYVISSEDKIIKTAKTPRRIPSRFGIEDLPYQTPETPFISVGFDCIPEAMAMVRRTIYEQTTGWGEWLNQGGEGLDLFLQVVLLSEVHFISQNLYYYRRHSQQVTQTTVKFEVQMQKLITKWKESREIPEEYKAKYAELAWWWEHRFLPYLWVKEGRAMMRDTSGGQSHHKYISGIRLHLRAIKPYLMSLLFNKS
ncbi:glycosyltransferase family 2 protein [Limnofasciculus baicalensis]|uniref:Glycosyltransferase n=1 Tax=Limnofasciculus baicalensis BBK-W-15 TaxID=2699891 RepID=A0AAE3GPP1_9CYAN|nr:glycosyltransferase family 2 protein [Limnofasciculus baicalensis]MCP2727686.1 glycosyltransferase [Limnofasciculus baicalensis BBK-W-15]